MLKLYGTPLSHFTRKVRILLGELGVQYEMVWLGNVLAASPEVFAQNPLMRVPTLVDGDYTLIESDHIARYLVGKYDARDWFGVRSEEVDALNLLAVANGVMDNEVVLILARRGGLEDLSSAYFKKLVAGIEEGLAWLDRNVPADAPMTWADIALICMWDHLRHYKLVAGFERYARIAARVDKFASRPAVSSTTPDASLATARAAGWNPG